MSLDLSGLRRTVRPGFRILTVCTGNICRSPLAELDLRSQLMDVPAISVASAGTMARNGQSMPAQAKDVAKRRGLDPETHGASYLEEQDIAGADLILTMAREHRRDVVRLFPRASRYTFTVREFARLGKDMTESQMPSVRALPLDDVVGRLNASVVDIAARRGLVEAPSSELDDDVVDPYRLSDEVFERSAQQLYPAVDVVVSILRGAALGELITGAGRGKS